jgi:hypothetical protein
MGSNKKSSSSKSPFLQAVQKLVGIKPKNHHNSNQSMSNSAQSTSNPGNEVAKDHKRNPFLKK